MVGKLIADHEYGFKVNLKNNYNRHQKLGTIIRLNTFRDFKVNWKI